MDYDIILLANHGIIAVGKDIYDTFFKLESVEAVAKTLTLAKLLGGEKDLPQDRIEELQELAKKFKK